MKKIYLILLFIIITNAPVFTQPSAVENHFKLGNERLDQKDYDGAISAFSECLRLSPKEAGCYGNRGLAFKGKSNFSQSIDDFTEAIKYSPNVAIYYNGRAISYYYQKSYDLAIADLKTSLKLKPDDAVKKYLDQMTILVEKKRHLQDVQALFGDALPPIPGNTFTADDFFKRGKEQFEKKDAAAIWSFSECLRLKPDFADCYSYRGQVYHRESQYEKAVADFTEAIKLQPQNVEYYVKRANILEVWLKRHEAAIADLTEVIKLQPKNSESYMQRGYAHKSKEYYQKAVEDFTQAINLAPHLSSKKVYYGVRAYVYYGWLKNYNAAIADYTEYIKIDPTDFMGYTERARAYFLNKNYEKAVADFTKAIELKTMFPGSTYAERGRVYCTMGKKVLGLADKKKAIELGNKENFPCQAVR